MHITIFLMPYPVVRRISRLIYSEAMERHGRSRNPMVLSPKVLRSRPEGQKVRCSDAHTYGAQGEEGVKP
jgi:hypothetical protein